MSTRWIEPYLPQDDRDGDDIVAEVFLKAGLNFGENLS